MADKMGLLGRALLGAAGGAAQANLERFEEEGAAKRTRALLDYKQKYSLELEDIRSSNNLMAVKLREKGAGERFEAGQLGQTERHEATLAQQADIAKDRTKLQILTIEGNQAIREQASTENLRRAAADAQAAADRAATARATLDYRTAQAEDKKAATAARAAEQAAQNEIERERWKQAAEQAERDEINDERRHKESLQGRADEVINTIENLDGSMRLIFRSGKIKDIPKAGTGPGGMTKEEADDQAQTDYDEINPLGPDFLRADPYGGLDEDTWVKRRRDELFSGVEAPPLASAQPSPTALPTPAQVTPTTTPSPAGPRVRGRVAQSVGKATRPNGDTLPDGITRTIKGKTYIVIGGEWYAQ